MATLGRSSKVVIDHLSRRNITNYAAVIDEEDFDSAEDLSSEKQRYRVEKADALETAAGRHDHTAVLKH